MADRIISMRQQHFDALRSRACNSYYHLSLATPLYSPTIDHHHHQSHYSVSIIYPLHEERLHKDSFFQYQEEQRRRMETPLPVTTTIHCLPQELLEEVLRRLPAKDVMNCKQVCKPWLKIIADSAFVTKYQVEYNNRMHLETCLVVQESPVGMASSVSLLSWNANDLTSHVSSTRLNFPDGYEFWADIKGPCNGIYLVQGKPDLLMNVSLNQFKALPQSNITAPCGYYSLTSYAQFGFDPTTNDYKVVVINDLWSWETDERQIGNCRAELYSLNTNSYSDYTVRLPLPFQCWDLFSKVYTFVNDCCHWFGYDIGPNRTEEDAVLTFDMVHEYFRKIKVPKIRHSEKELATLVPFHNRATIGIIVYPAKGLDKSFVVWEMERYCLDEGAWIKKYTVGQVQVIHQLVGFYGGNRFLWTGRRRKFGPVRLVFFKSDDSNTATQRRDLQVYGESDSIDAATYMESIISLRRGNKIDGQCFSCRLVPES